MELDDCQSKHFLPSTNWMITSQHITFLPQTNWLCFSTFHLFPENRLLSQPASVHEHGPLCLIKLPSSPETG